MAEMPGFVYFLLGFIILLLFILISRVSALSKMINTLRDMLKEAEADRALYIQGTSPLGSGSKAVPNAVIAAITAAVNQYRMDNN